MILTAIVKALAAAGATPDMLAAAVEAYEVAVEAERAARRERTAARRQARLAAATVQTEPPAQDEAEAVVALEAPKAVPARLSPTGAPAPRAPYAFDGMRLTPIDVADPTVALVGGGGLTGVRARSMNIAAC